MGVCFSLIMPLCGNFPPANSNYMLTCQLGVCQSSANAGKTANTYYCNCSHQFRGYGNVLMIPGH